MNRPYSAEELDAIIRASLEFKEIMPNDHFCASNLGGRQGLSPDEAINGILTKKMKYIAGLDTDIIE